MKSPGAMGRNGIAILVAPGTHRECVRGWRIGRRGIAKRSRHRENSQRPRSAYRPRKMADRRRTPAGKRRRRARPPQGSQWEYPRWQSISSIPASDRSEIPPRGRREPNRGQYQRTLESAKGGRFATHSASARRSNSPPKPPLPAMASSEYHPVCPVCRIRPGSTPAKTAGE